MLPDMKLSKAQITKITQSVGSLGSWLGNLGKKALRNIYFPLARDDLLGVVSNLTLNVTNKFERKIRGKGAVIVGKGFILFSSNEAVNNIIKNIKSLQDSSVLINAVTKAVKHEIKKQKGDFIGALLAPLAVSLVQPVISSVVKVKKSS